MKIIRAPKKCNRIADIFLAGSILHYPTQEEMESKSRRKYVWRDDVMKGLSDVQGLIFNPERISFPRLGSKEYLEQINWEREYLRNSKLAVFWLSVQKPTSYASRVEIGFAKGLEILIIIGVEEGFPGAEYIEAFLGIKPEGTLEDVIVKTKQKIKSIKEG